ncbi:uncharacterized protein (DUF1697 family) [Halarchaeum rubridurum]|uniref:Uncharacterized protein (DUF1697 family) n=1 Tax=Halarchaeum rubridurum TaxID=489911 RepID=A0A830G2W1_9EURY|nr:hypothetical protein [Halarchaeum rubridurum]MBP1955543.1 uncharacterized protein (DUF1697 family) [Halarchaeum rubridurum]GGM73217.1 hypothetical protein GCM10009017_23930 [Halarchaeum rubridurum]
MEGDERSATVQEKLEDALEHAENDRTRFLLRSALQDLLIDADVGSD